MKHTSKTIIYVVYDGITNSVFSGQVLTPVINQLENDATLHAIIISFESSHPCDTQNIEKKHPRLSLVILKKIPFIGSISLWYATHQLKKILQHYTNYTLTARGPLAGKICLNTLSYVHKHHALPSTLTVQARGLLAEEYRYTHAHEQSTIKKMLYTLRTYQLQALEQSVYSANIIKNYQTKYAPTTITIEAVSTALKEYLLATFGADANAITIAHQDLPPVFTKEQLYTWQKEVRTELHISPTAHVYCYNGSIKPWQCPEETVTFFKEELQKNANNFLLVLTQDVAQFKKLLEQKQLPPHTYHVMHVPHSAMYRYLAACDSGIIFREKSVINWTSRPTKIIEYQAVGLHIVHNNTVAMLTTLPPTPRG